MPGSTTVFGPDPALGRVLSLLQKRITYGLEWSDNGRELDAEFEKVGRIDRERRLKGREEIGWPKDQTAKGRGRDGDNHSIDQWDSCRLS